MLFNRLKQFREYNKLKESQLAEILKITESEYHAYETGSKVPTIDIIGELCVFYKVTTDEFYGYTPRLILATEQKELSDEDVPVAVLKMSDLSWDEVQLISYYRKIADKDKLIQEIIKQNTEAEENP